ncbi:hypothetical protein SeMB42_g07017 [Synchytrium endobioticum]|uniref:Mediator of RNA polymerase II transcription subunit 20 n=1 Tax=Synchytrium endobioticum TaxID=286115 RepID=A0A507CFR9_9FUNG|nr:hypothetical protein SeMB42_g07017 [Synchytrium endobioticum]
MAKQDSIVVLFLNDSQLSAVLNEHVSNRISAFTAICRVLRDPNTKNAEASMQKALYLMTFPQHQITYSVMSANKQNIVLKGSRELETMILTLKNMWTVRQSIYIEGSAYARNDRTIRIGTVSVGNTIRGTVIEFTNVLGAEQVRNDMDELMAKAGIGNSRGGTKCVTVEGVDEAIRVAFALDAINPAETLSLPMQYCRIRTPTSACKNGQARNGPTLLPRVNGNFTNATTHTHIMASNDSGRKLEVIGAGLGRTGTMSLKVALEQLGFGKCYHMLEVFQHPNDAQVFADAWDGKEVDWSAFFEQRGYYAAVDYPVCMYLEQLMKAYPDAKVILSVRDPGKWHDSVMQTIWRANEVFKSWESRLFSMPFGLRIATSPGLHDLYDFKGTGKPVSDRENAIKEFNKWTEHVKKVVPKDRLLVFEVKEGWAPLCKFLGVPVPLKEFPNVNDSKQFASRIEKMQRVQRTYTTACLLTIGVIAYYITTRYCRRS